MSKYTNFKGVFHFQMGHTVYIDTVLNIIVHSKEFTFILKLIAFFITF